MRVVSTDIDAAGLMAIDDKRIASVAGGFLQTKSDDRRALPRGRVAVSRHYPYGRVAARTVVDKSVRYKAHCPLCVFGKRAMWLRGAWR